VTLVKYCISFRVKSKSQGRTSQAYATVDVRWIKRNFPEDSVLVLASKSFMQGVPKTVRNYFCHIQDIFIRY